MFCGTRTERSIKMLATEVRRLRSSLQAISKFGRANTGCGYTCARMAEKALGLPPNAPRSATPEVKP